MQLPTGDGQVDATTEETPDGRRIVVSRTVDAPAQACWELLIDTHRWSEWGPSVRDVDCDSRTIEPGTTGQIQTVGGIWVPFEVTSCTDRRWTWSVAKIPATGHRVRGDRPCTIDFEIPLLAVGYTPVCVRALETLERLANG